MTDIQFYNSLSKKKENFEPINPKSVGLYSCGPTVYDNVHIGNLRAFVMPDTLQRVLRHIGGYDVTWVMNITDIDDKMIARAQERQPNEDPKAALQHLANEYESKFLNDLQAVGIQMEDINQMPHATDHIQEMQKLITELLNDEIAYVTDGSIYFSLENYTQSGKTYGQLIDINYDAQARIDDQDQKQGAGDFALWKAAKTGEPSWEFEVKGESLPGRPGWHIECSAMSTRYLGEEFDLHTGGVDLKFPHHENEIAQSGGNLARFWLHNEHLTIDDAKMSKSEGNFSTLSDIDDPLAYRLMLLQAHYRSQMNFSDEAYGAAKNRLSSLREWASRVVNNPSSSYKDLTHYHDNFAAALADDLATPQALAVLAEVESLQDYGSDALNFLQLVDETLGLQLLKSATAIDDSSVQELLDDRLRARQQSDWAASDLLREQLSDRGIGVEDTADGQIFWQRF